MNGRLEKELEYDQSIENMLQELPRFMTEWHNELKASGYTGATRCGYIDRTRRLLKFINPNCRRIRISDITRNAINEFMTSIQTMQDKNGIYKETSFSYRNSMYIALNNFCNFINDNDYSPTKLVIKKPIKREDEEEKKKEMLDANDFHSILAAADHNPIEFYRRRDKAILCIFMNTGVRRAGLQSINIEDLDIDNRILHVIDKGHKIHKYKLNRDTINILLEWLEYRERMLWFRENTNALFITKQCKRISLTSVAEVVMKYTKEALGKELRPHKLRAGYCSILYEKTRDIEFVRKAVGHAKLETTQRYIVLDEDKEREMASELMAEIF